MDRSSLLGAMDVNHTETDGALAFLAIFSGERRSKMLSSRGRMNR